MIRILPRSQGNVVGIECSDLITPEDYTQILIPAFNRVLAEHGKIRLLLEFSANFSGYSMGALAADIKYGVKHARNFERWAMINGPGWAKWLLQIIDTTTSCRCKSFSKIDRDKAWNFIEE